MAPQQMVHNLSFQEGHGDCYWERKLTLFKCDNTYEVKMVTWILDDLWYIDGVITY